MIGRIIAGALLCVALLAAGPAPAAWRIDAAAFVQPVLDSALSDGQLRPLERERKRPDSMLL